MKASARWNQSPVVHFQFSLQLTTFSSSLFSLPALGVSSSITSKFELQVSSTTFHDLNFDFHDFQDQTHFPRLFRSRKKL